MWGRGGGHRDRKGPETRINKPTLTSARAGVNVPDKWHVFTYPTRLFIFTDHEWFMGPAEGLCVHILYMCHNWGAVSPVRRGAHVAIGGAVL